MSKKNRTYSHHTLQAIKVFSGLIQVARKKQGWSEQELAERAGISRYTVQKVAQGNPGTELGIYFELASLLGIPLFEADDQALTAMLDSLKLQAALLPKRIDKDQTEVFDDF